VKQALLMVRKVDTGPDGDNDPSRPLARLRLSGTRSASGLLITPAAHGPAPRQPFEGLAQSKPTTTRKLYFSEHNEQSEFFLTVEDQKPHLFDPNSPLAITTKQGSVEDRESFA
jgi:hypothetical protein